MLRWNNLILLLVASVVFSFPALAKPGANVSLQGSAERKLASYSQATEQVVLKLPAKPLTVEISLNTEGNLNVSSSEVNQKLQYDGSGELILILNIETAEDEVAYIGLNVVLTDQQGKQEARALGLRLLVGDASLADKKHTIQKTHEKQKIKTYPAVETIKQH